MKRVALIGPGATGKTTLAHALTAHLRAEGHETAVVPEAGFDYAWPFNPALFDTSTDPHEYAITAKMAAETRVGFQRHVAIAISDRSPLDHAAYLAVRPELLTRHTTSIILNARGWMGRYDLVLFLRSEGTDYVDNGTRAPAGLGLRHKVEDWILANMAGSCQHIRGSHESRLNAAFEHIKRIL